MLGVPKGQINSFSLNARRKTGPEMARLTGWGSLGDSSKVTRLQVLVGHVALCVHSLPVDHVPALGCTLGLRLRV